jgi:hypothetical protein
MGREELAGIALGFFIAVGEETVRGTGRELGSR